MTETRTLQQDKLLPRDSRDFFGHVYIICYSKLPLCSQKTVRLLGEIMSAGIFSRRVEAIGYLSILVTKLNKCYENRGDTNLQKNP